MLQRDQLRQQHAIVRGLRHREMEVAAGARVGRVVVDHGLGFGDEARELGVVGGGRVFGGKLGRERFDRALRIHDLGGGDAGEVELHGQRLGEQARVAARHARAAALAHLDVRDAERLQRAQASRATMRLTPKRAARSFSVPRKSPGLSFLANSASRTSATICEESEAERPTKIGAVSRVSPRTPGRIAGCTEDIGASMKILKIVSWMEKGRQAGAVDRQRSAKSKAW